MSKCCASIFLDETYFNGKVSVVHWFLFFWVFHFKQLLSRCPWNSPILFVFSKVCYRLKTPANPIYLNKPKWARKKYWQCYIPLSIYLKLAIFARFFLGVFLTDYEDVGDIGQFLCQLRNVFSKLSKTMHYFRPTPPKKAYTIEKLCLTWNVCLLFSTVCRIFLQFHSRLPCQLVVSEVSARVSVLHLILTVWADLGGQGDKVLKRNKEQTLLHDLRYIGYNLKWKERNNLFSDTSVLSLRVLS